MSETRHDPTWFNARRYGRWCECSCGWVSAGGTIAFAQDAFGRHLLDTLDGRESREAGA